MIIDLHCHPNLKSFNSGYPKPIANMWEMIEHKIDSKLAKDLSEITNPVWKASQTNLYSLAEGNVRVFQLSLYPIERGFLHFRNVPNAIFGKRRANTLLEVITGYNIDAIEHQKKYVDYFKELNAEYEYVKKQQGKSPNKKYEFILVNNYKELQEALNQDNTLIGIVTIEGAHVLGTGTDAIDKLNKGDLINMLTQNIATIKKWDFPPFVINLSHHFWNHLAGHAKSFKRPINSFLNQNKGKNKGITETGWHVIRELLSTQNGKRILIDTKHMSAQARKEYYAFVGNHNYLNPKNKIPIISSHACANGFKTIDSSIQKADLIVKTRKSKLFKWSINISDEEANIIHDSEGLIGLMMDKGNLGGVDYVLELTNEKDALKQRKLFARLFMRNAFQLVKAVGKKTAWNMIAFGSDFDGSISHMDPYPTAKELPLLQQDILELLEQENYNKDWWFGYTPQEITDKIFYKNAMDFYKKFFV